MVLTLRPDNAKEAEDVLGVGRLALLSDQAAWPLSGREATLPLNRIWLAMVRHAADTLHEQPSPGPVPTRETRSDGSVRLRDSDGNLHCEDGWAAQHPDGRRVAMLHGERAVVVRLRDAEGMPAVSRLMPERDAKDLGIGLRRGRGYAERSGLRGDPPVGAAAGRRAIHRALNRRARRLRPAAVNRDGSRRCCGHARRLIEAPIEIRN